MNVQNSGLTTAQPSQRQVVLPPGTGLEYLIPTTGLIVQQQIEWGEILLGVDFNNRYHIVDNLGRRLFFAAENSDACALMCGGKCRDWNIILYNVQGIPVVNGKRTSSCLGGGLCDNSVVVMSGAGHVLGSISQNSTCCTGSWNIHDDGGNIILRMDGPECSMCCPGMATCYEAEFPVKTQDNQIIGKVTKQFSGMLREMLTQADTFCVQYPADLHMNIKAVLIYAAFMIDFIFYENVQDQNRGMHGRRHGYGHPGMGYY